MFLSYFLSSKNSIFALLLLGASLHGMEEEAIPLLNSEDAIINADDLERMYLHPHEDLYELPSGFYTGERKFYDKAARNKAKYNACKRCALFTTLFTLAGAGAGTIAVLGAESILYVIGKALKGDNTTYSIIESIDPFTTTLMSGFFTFCSFVSSGSIKALVEILLFKDNSLLSHERVSLDQITSSLDDARLLCRAKDTYHKFLTPPKHRFEFLNTFFANSRKMLSIQHAIESRNPPVRFEYAKVGYELKKIMIQSLQKDLTKEIFSYFPEKNILLHIMGHLEKSKWSHDVFLATEKEFMSLAFLKTLNMNGYSLASELAKYGWCSFEKSEKYPIRIDWLYFDRQALERDNVNTHYGSLISLDELRPRAFMPCCKELVKYYKFEEDPAYEAEFKRPSNPKIKKLLIHRKNFLEKKYGPSIPFEVEPDLNNTN